MSTPEAAPTPIRRFNLLDLSALIVASAVGLSLWRFMCAGGSSPLGRPSNASTAVAMPFAWALVVLRRIGPRPRLESRIPPPGDAAALAASLAPFVALLGGVPGRWADGFFPAREAVRWIYFSTNTGQPASAVAGAWAALYLMRAFRPTGDWIDRAGITLGIASIVSAVALINLWGFLIL